MSCGNKNCGCAPTTKCGCGDQALHTPCSCNTPMCPDPAGGLSPSSCGEVMSDRCIVHDGNDGLVDFRVEVGDSMAMILQKIAIKMSQPACIDPYINDPAHQDCQSVWNLQSTLISITGIKLAWTIAPGSVLIDIVVEYNQDGMLAWLSTVALGATAIETTIGPLLPGTYYNIRVVSTDGTHDCTSATIKVKTL